MGRTPILKVANLCIRRSSTHILQSVDWQIQRDEHWVILGANGSGKTSLLSAVTGYLTPTSGEIFLLGRRYGRFDWRELRKQIGLVGSSIRQMIGEEQSALAIVLSGKDAVINFSGRVSEKERARAGRILKRIECSHLAERAWGVLSQGERQRVLIGRALMGRPRLLIVDEPCAGLDPAAREHFVQFLGRLGGRRGAPTLVLVTHHVEEIIPIFSRVLLLRDGRVWAAGKKREVLTTRLMSEAFGSRVRVVWRAGRCRLQVAAKLRVVV